MAIEEKSDALFSARDSNALHAKSDVDASTYGQHHTLGVAPTQASPGNHTHDGITSKALATAGAHIIQDEGTPLTARANLNFIGAGVVATDNGGTNATDVTIAGSAVSDGDKGDVVVSGGGTIWVVDTNVVTNAKLSNVATNTIKGRITAGTGSPEDLTPTQVVSMLPLLKTALADTGVTAARSKTVVVADAAVATTSKLLVSWGAVVDSDTNHPEMDNVSFLATPAAGSFTLRVSASDILELVAGPYRINYLIGA